MISHYLSISITDVFVAFFFVEELTLPLRHRVTIPHFPNNRNSDVHHSSQCETTLLTRHFPTSNLVFAMSGKHLKPQTW